MTPPFPDRVGYVVKRYPRFSETFIVNEILAHEAMGRAIDIFETVLSDHPDAKFLDVILFNYGRCLYRMERKAEARRQFDQLIAEFPESPLAGDAKNITEALAKAGF